MLYISISYCPGQYCYGKECIIHSSHFPWACTCIQMWRRALTAHFFACCPTPHTPTAVISPQRHTHVPPTCRPSLTSTPPNSPRPSQSDGVKGGMHSFEQFSLFWGRQPYFVFFTSFFIDYGLHCLSPHPSTPAAAISSTPLVIPNLSFKFSVLLY